MPDVEYQAGITQSQGIIDGVDEDVRGDGAGGRSEL